MLTARYFISLNAPLFLKHADTDIPTFAALINGFAVTVRPEQNAFDGTHSKKKVDRNWTRVYSHLIVTVSKDVHSPPDDSDKDTLHRYIEQIRNDYAVVAIDAVNRLLHFFKYTLRQPLIRELDDFREDIANPQWLNEKMEIIYGKQRTHFIIRGLPGAGQECGTVFYEKKYLPRVERAIGSGSSVRLRDEILYDAQSAFYENKLRRAVLELALFLELIIKESFYGKSTLASSTLEYLEDKGKIHTQLISYLDIVAKDVFGRSFKEEEPIRYKWLDNLLRCRNKVVHRGILEYREDGGNIVNNINGGHFVGWWKSAECAAKWLEDRTKSFAKTQH